jgi:hypothetical protein
MNGRYIIAIFFISFFTKCRPNSDPDRNLVSNISFQDASFHQTSNADANKRSAIEGTWELRSSSGWGHETKYSPGNGNTFIFSSSSYARYENHVIIESGKYQIHKDSLCYLDYHQIFDCIIFNNELRVSIVDQYSNIWRELMRHQSVMLGQNFLKFTHIGWSDTGPSFYARIN